MKHTFALTLFAASLSANAFADPVKVQVLSAVVKDQRIGDATVILQKNGAQSVAANTDQQGNATLASNFTDANDTLIIIKKPGYSNLVAKCPCKDMTYALSPVMTNLDGLRIVLNWGASPNDLDSHLAFADQHIFWSRQTGMPGTDANLDVDDTNSFGPETITIEKKHSGESYVYAVHNYSYRTDLNSTSLANSNAKVLVYIGQSLVRSYYVPQGVTGNLWTVFRITPEGEFQDINSVSSTQKEAADIIGKFNGYLDSSIRVASRASTATDISAAKTINTNGETAYRANQLDRAIELFQQAIELNPNFGQAYSNLGLAYQKANRTAEAIWANRKAIALASGPNANTVRASSYFNIAKIYENAGQYQDALTQYQSARREKANAIYDTAIERMQSKVR